jgi:hypothetical protein
MSFRISAPAAKPASATAGRHVLIESTGGESAKKNYNVSISNQVINKIKFFKVHGSLMGLSVVYFLSILNTIMRLMIFTILSPFNPVYHLKMKAYAYTLPKIFTATEGL